jgi:hypothetical protein
MHPIFIARGPAFKKKYVASPFESVNVYSLLCHLLDISPRPNNGSLDNIKHILSDGDNLDITMISCKFLNSCFIKTPLQALTGLAAKAQEFVLFTSSS